MLDLVMVFHCHQPVGNFHTVFKKAVSKCYLPILEHLDAYPSVKAGLHFSGPLMEWLEEHRPHCIDLFASLVKRGQVEPLSGGFYEPLLAAIPGRDAHGQVCMMNDYIERRLGVRPMGLWLTERVWDTSIPLILAGTGIEYTVVDDTHFYYAGLRPDQIYGDYVTEKEGRVLRLLATPMEMRYLIPFREVEEVVGHLRGLEEAGRSLAVYGDDGEKFGLWPGTYEWVIRKGWLDRFFRAISENADWLRSTLPGKYISSKRPAGRIYLPQASYEEMTEWALPSDRGQILEKIISSLKADSRWEEWRPFIRGGVWDNFLVKYDEANRIHKKMLFLSEKVIGADNRVRKLLWRAQCNCAYWHGVFGGLYMGHLRRALYENLLKVQAELMERTKEDIWISCLDIDKDGSDEILLCNSDLALGIEPGRGGGIFEISYMPKALNLSDTLTRRHETYHRALQETALSSNASTEGVASIHDLPSAAHEDLSDILSVDSYTRSSLLDHFFLKETGVADYAMNNHTEIGDFVQANYLVKKAGTSADEGIVTMAYTGRVGASNIGLKKSVRVEKNARATIDYRFECLGPQSVSVLYGCEFNLTLFSDQDTGRYYYIPEMDLRREVSETGSQENVTRFDLVNRPDHLTVNFSFSDPVSVWFFPLMTVSKSEKGLEQTYQGSSLLFAFPVNLSCAERLDFQFHISILSH